MPMSERGQKVLLWWGLTFTAIYGFTMRFLLHILPPVNLIWILQSVH